MKNASTEELAADVRRRMVDIGGRTAQDFGLGRVVGQVLLHLYLQSDARSLDDIAADLRLSKAAVSIASRQLENLGLIRRIWKSGDRRNYYRTADNIGIALQTGLLSLVRQKVDLVGVELDQAANLLDNGAAASSDRGETGFLRARVERARELRRRVQRVLDNPVVKFLAKR